MKPTMKPKRTAQQRADEEAIRRQHAVSPVRQRPAGAISRQSFTAVLSLVARFKVIRESLGLTLAEVAERMGIDPPALSRLETGKMLNPTLATLHKWAEALGQKMEVDLSSPTEVSPSKKGKNQAMHSEHTPEAQMKYGNGTVFVLGAGFTKAFLLNAPLLVDDFCGDELRERFRGFPAALAVLESELNNPDHGKGKMNLERLMTRLAGGMPYDFGEAENRELDFLLVELKRVLMRRLTQARAGETASSECLWLFASHVLEYGNHCITFNYDDLIDQALCEARLPFIAEPSWNPEWGYGFPCGMTEELVNNYPLIREGSRMVLLKLHGSMNWRVPLGARQPFEVNAIHHHEEWFVRSRGKIPLQSLKALLESDPVVIPPILTKTGLVEQPVLRVVWECARSVLQKADKVVFIGYSLPITDIAAGFLFSESLQHLAPNHVTIVDFSTEEGKEEKLENIMRAYRKVFPAISQAQIHLGGACCWMSDKLTTWLFNSRGDPIAFRAARWVFDPEGNSIGDLRSYGEPHCEELWHERYRGEICNGHRLLFKEGKYENEPNRGGQLALHKLRPTLPKSIEPVDLPPGWRDLVPADLRTS